MELKSVYFTNTLSHAHTHTDTHTLAEWIKLKRFHFVPPPLNQSFSIQQFDLLFKTGLSPSLVFIHPFSLSLPLSSLAPQTVSRGDPHDEGNCNNLLNAMATVVRREEFKKEKRKRRIGWFRKQANLSFCPRQWDERMKGWQQCVYEREEREREPERHTHTHTGGERERVSEQVFAHSQGAGLLIMVGMGRTLLMINVSVVQA